MCLLAAFVTSPFLLAAPAAVAAEEAPVAIVRSFHEALSSGDREKVLALLDPGVVIFEQGGAEMSRQEYASRHLAEDMEFCRSTSRKVQEQRSGVAGEGAWVLTTSETSGTFRGKEVSSRDVETMVLTRDPSGWHITHIHWSSRRRS